jgi:hypothetical protein
MHHKKVEFIYKVYLMNRVLLMFEKDLLGITYERCKIELWSIIHQLSFKGKTAQRSTHLIFRALSNRRVFPTGGTFCGWIIDLSVTNWQIECEAPWSYLNISGICMKKFMKPLILFSAGFSHFELMCAAVAAALGLTRWARRTPTGYRQTKQGRRGVCGVCGGGSLNDAQL